MPIHVHVHVHVMSHVHVCHVAWPWVRPAVHEQPEAQRHVQIPLLPTCSQFVAHAALRPTPRSSSTHHRLAGLSTTAAVVPVGHAAIAVRTLFDTTSAGATPRRCMPACAAHTPPLPSRASQRPAAAWNSSGSADGRTALRDANHTVMHAPKSSTSARARPAAEPRAWPWSQRDRLCVLPR